MADASSLHCPNCGAAAEPQATRCVYCKARLATVSCPQCFALMFDGSAFCPKCGAAAARVEKDAADARCPGCGNAMHHVAIGTASLLECSRCDGIWLDAADFERICAHQASRAAGLHRWPREAATTSLEAVRYRPCVRCGKMMNRVNFGKLSGTVVDVCRGHGTFLDRGELHAVATFIEAGGLDRMRQREIQDLKDEQRRLAEVEAALARRRPYDSTDAGVSLGWTAAEFLDLIDLMRGR
jgi:Zn-finger nucleic acid-binding protein